MEKQKFNLLFAVFCAAVFGLILFAPTKASLQVTRPDVPGPVDLRGVEMVKDVLNPKIEYALGKLYNIYRTEGADKAREFAGQRDIDFDENGVCVVAEAEIQNASLGLYPEASIVKFQVQALGGKIETTYQNLVQSRLPIPSLEALSANPAVKFVRLPLKAMPTANIVSEGVAVTGADLWQSIAAYRNSGGTNVCVLDAGFTGYAALLGTELPASVTTKSFRANGNLSADVHGAACAEIVHDMAPNANLWLVNFGTDVEQHSAVDYIIGQGVKVISYSMGWWNSGDGKGTGPICADVEKAEAAGILWSASAGNAAQTHWEGTFTDADNDKWLDFASGDEILSWWVPAYTLTAVFINWDDWGNWNGSTYSGSNQDYDATLYYYSSGTWRTAASSSGNQTGSQWPTEAIGYWYSTVGRYWGVGIKNYKTTRNCKVEIFAYGNSGAIEYNVPQGSLLIPADSPSAIAVGATDWKDDSFHTYSSQGPTHDGRTKPDFGAPSGVSTKTYGANASPVMGKGTAVAAPASFSGTSASAPCLAGALALLLEKTPYSAAQVRNILNARALDLGDPGEDNKFGKGRLNLKKK